MRNKSKEELIAELEEAQEKIALLSQNEERYRTLVENVGDYMWVLELASTKMVYVNKAVKKILGFTPEEVKKIPLAERYPPHSLKIIQKVLEEELSKDIGVDRGESRKIELEAYHKNGHKVWLEVTTRPLRDDTGKPTAILGIASDISERIGTQKTIEKERKELFITLNSIGDAAIATDAKGKITRMNPVAESLTGWSAKEARGKVLSEIFKIYNAHTRKEVGNSVSKVIEEGRVVGLSNPTLLIAKDGTEYQISDSAAPILGDGEAIIGVVLVFRDISEEYKALETLKKSEKKYKSIFENAVMGIYRIAPDGEILAANKALLDMIGYASFEELSKRNLEIEDGNIPEEYSRERFKEEIAKNDEVVGRETLWIGREGKEIYVNENAKVIRDEKGDILYYEGTVEDITERKLIEKSLKESEEKFRGLVEASSDWIWETNAEGVYTYASPQVEDILGYKPEEMIGKHPFDTMPTEEAKRVKEIFTKFSNFANRIDSLENVNLHKNGKHVVLETSAVPFLDDDGKLLGYRGVDRDITGRKAYERERDNLIGNLAQRGMLLQTAANISRAVLSILSLDELLEETVELIRKHFNYYYVGIFLVDEEKEYVHLKAGTGEAGKKMLADNYKFKIGEGSMVGWSVANTKARIALDAVKDTVRFANPLLPKTRSEMALPLVIKNEAIGSLIVQSEKEAAFTEEDVSALETMVDQLAIAIQNAQLYEQAQSEIEERERAEKSLKESEKNFRLLFENSPLGIYIATPEGKILDANQALLEILDFSSLEATKQINILTIPALQENGYVDSFRKCVDKKEILFLEFPYISVWGVTLNLSSYMIPAINEKGEVEKIYTLMENITERKEAEKALKKAETYLTNIVDSMPSALIGINSEGKVTQWNSEAERVSGLTATQALGRRLGDAFPRLSAELEHVRVAMRSREVQTETKRAFQENGETHYEDVTIYPLIANGVEGVVIRVDDVTEKVQIEELMLQSEKMLSVGGLAAGMAHEINNPLAGMMQTASVMSNRLTRVDMLANQRAAEEVGISMASIRTFMEMRGIPRMLNAINESGQRVAEIVDNMLSFARRSSRAATTIDLVKLLDKTLELAATDYDLKKQYDFKTIKIVKEYEENLPYVPCEGSKIQQVFLNILRNGAQSMHETPSKEENPRFVLRMAHEKDTNMIRIEIEDNGCGMDEETQKRIFEPFFTTKLVGEGTGLGLSVSFFIITENHGGTLDVESEPNQGAKFIIRLPVEGRRA